MSRRPSQYLNPGLHVAAIENVYVVMVVKQGLYLILP